MLSSLFPFAAAAAEQQQQQQLTIDSHVPSLSMADDTTTNYLYKYQANNNTSGCDLLSFQTQHSKPILSADFTQNFLAAAAAATRTTTELAANSILTFPFSHIASNLPTDVLLDEHQSPSKQPDYLCVITEDDEDSLSLNNNINSNCTIKVPAVRQDPWISCIQSNRQTATLEVSFNQIESIDLPSLQLSEPDTFDYPQYNVLDVNSAETNAVLNAFCEQVHCNKSIELDIPNTSIFPVSSYYKMRSSSKGHTLMKEYINIPFIEFLENQPCSDKFNSSKHSSDIHSMVANFKDVIYDAQQFNARRQGDIIPAILSRSQYYSLGQVVCQRETQLVTVDGFEVPAYCIWQVFPVAFNDELLGVLVKQTWVIYNLTEIVQSRAETNSKNTAAGKLKAKSIQEQVDEMNENNIVPSPFTNKVISFLHKFKYISKNKKKPFRQQDQFPHKTCKYRTLNIPNNHNNNISSAEQQITPITSTPL